MEDGWMDIGQAINVPTGQILSEKERQTDNRQTSGRFSGPLIDDR